MELGCAHAARGLQTGRDDARETMPFKQRVASADPTEAEGGVELSIVMPCLRATPSQAASARRAAFCRLGRTGEILAAGLHGRQCRRQASLARSTDPALTARSPSRIGASGAISTAWLCASTRMPRHRGSSCHEQRGAGGMGNRELRRYAPRHQRDLRCNRRTLAAYRPCRSSRRAAFPLAASWPSDQAAA